MTCDDTRDHSSRRILVIQNDARLGKRVRVLCDGDGSQTNLCETKGSGEVSESGRCTEDGGQLVLYLCATTKPVLARGQGWEEKRGGCVERDIKLRHSFENRENIENEKKRKMRR